jgi:hypothetical protein
MYQPSDLLQVQRSEEKANKVIMMLEANTEVLQSLKTFYTKIGENKDFPLNEEVKSDLVSFRAQLHDMISDSKLQLTRAKLLVQITSNRKALVCSILIAPTEMEADRIVDTATPPDPSNDKNRETVVQHVQFHNHGPTRYDCHVRDCFRHLNLSASDFCIGRLSQNAIISLGS